MPVVVVLAFALSAAQVSSSSSSKASAQSTAAVVVTAPTPSPNVDAPCTLVESKLPVKLAGLLPRIVHPTPDPAAQVVAWGTPAVVFDCGVPRPSELVPNSSIELYPIDNVPWLEENESGAIRFVTVDRAVYIAVTVPKSYGQPPLAPISDAIAAALPPVCHLTPDGPTPPGSEVGPLCTHRP